MSATNSGSNDIGNWPSQGRRSHRGGLASPACGEELKSPVLLIHGVYDSTVPPTQSQEMARALKAAGRTCDYLEIDHMGHTGWSEVQSKQVLSRATAFLEKAFT